jgi:hypothetical protein
MGKMRAGLLIGAIAMIASGCEVSVSSSRPSPSASPTPSVSASPVAAVELLCRLPAIGGDHSGLLNIPADPPNQGGDLLTWSEPLTSGLTLPNGENAPGFAYNSPLKRWLPVPYKWVAPSGTQYAYTDSQGRIHLVGVSDGSDRILASGAAWGIYSFASDGIYAGQRDASQQPSLLGLWRISPSTGAAQRIAAQGAWLVIGAGAAWSVVQEGSAPSTVPSIPESSVGIELLRLDLQTSQVTTWYTSREGRFRVAAIDAGGHPVLVGVDTKVLWIVTAAGVVQTTPVGAPYLHDIMADSHGVWFSIAWEQGSLHLLEGATDRVMGHSANGLQGVYFAGPCQ